MILDTILVFAVLRERIDWMRLLALAFIVVFWVGFFLALRRAV